MPQDSMKQCHVIPQHVRNTEMATRLTKVEAASVVEYNTLRTIHNDSKQIQHDTIQYITIQYKTIQCSRTQFDAV